MKAAATVEEKSQIQALQRSQPLLPMRPGQVERRTHDSMPHATTSLFAALEVATGNVLAKCYRRHRCVEFRDFLDRSSNSKRPSKPFRWLKSADQILASIARFARVAILQ